MTEVEGVAIWAETTDDGALLGEGLLLNRVGCLAQFAMDFMLIGARGELVEQMTVADQLDDASCSQKWDQPFPLLGIAQA